MATANQIYAMVNDAAEESLGMSAIRVKDTASLVSLGNVVLSSNENKEKFYKTLLDRIGRTVIAVRAFEVSNRAVKRDEMEWGFIYQKISFKKKEAVENPSWNSETQASPYDIGISTEVVQKLFYSLGTWSYTDSIPDYQLFTAFTNASAMGAFISGIYTNINNQLKIDEENLANLAIATNIAGCLIKGKTAQKRNLLNEFNTKFTKTLTVGTALTDPDFLKYASFEIGKTVRNMQTPTTLFNAEDIVRQTTKDNLVVEVLDQYAASASVYLESDTYHKELVELPRYESVAFWQGSGDDFGIEDVSKINIKNIELATELNATGEIEQGGIIAFVHDRDSAASIITRMRDFSVFNPYSERLNIGKHADTGYAVDLSENAVVFYISE